MSSSPDRRGGTWGWRSSIDAPARACGFARACALQTTSSLRSPRSMFSSQKSAIGSGRPNGPLQFVTRWNLLVMHSEATGTHLEATGTRSEATGTRWNTLPKLQLIDNKHVINLRPSNFRPSCFLLVKFFIGTLRRAAMFAAASCVLNSIVVSLFSHLFADNRIPETGYRKP